MLVRQEASMNNQRGSVLIWMTLMIVLLMVMVGMGLDTGQITYARNQAQSAVDAAALAAVSGLPSSQIAGNTTEIQNRATAFNSKNDYVSSGSDGIKSSDVSLIHYDFTKNTIDSYNEPLATANGVRVARSADTNHPVTTPVFLTPLMNLLGISTPGTQQVNVSAVSTIRSEPAIPIALWGGLCGPNGTEVDDVQIKMQHPTKTGLGENACWTTFFDCSSGASDIKALFDVSDSCSGKAPGDVEIGSQICQNRGQVNSTLQRADNFFMKEHPNSWWLVPVIGGGGNCDPSNPAKVTNWAKIYPTSVDDKGNPKSITANIVCDPNLRNSLINTNLCYSHRLVREPNKGY